ncbi:PAS domain S-box protein [Fulvivirga ligni]|uniref:PAS domain S-box protein n=1 Tax=Fulvivirga ligni TaxID=2904246 RepID=UPI001F21C43F|nr:PAS domain S-box protein [Fulvivirga ligni]UII21555.1 PAS domain-containing protein [Fulvivirga ligni]
MRNWLVRSWNRVLNIGMDPRLNKTQLIRLHTINAFLFIAMTLTILFIAVFSAMGSYSTLEGLSLLPIALFILYLNSRKKYTAARLLLIYGLITASLILAISDRRTGTEFLIIAIGCCSTLIFEKPISIVLAFLTALASYSFYQWYDNTFPFEPDPTLPYVLIESTLLFLSALMILCASLVFRSLLHNYAKSLEQANNEIQDINIQLKDSNEELTATTEKLNVSIQQKKSELKAYLDIIDINLFAVTTDKESRILSINKPALALTGYTKEELLHKSFNIFNSGYHDEAFFKEMNETIHAGESWRGEIRDKAKDGSHFWLDMVIMPVKENGTDISYFLCLALPITDRKIVELERTKNLETLNTIANNASHQVRRPIASLLGLLNLHRDMKIKPEELPWIASKLHDHILELDKAASHLTYTIHTHTLGIEELIKKGNNGEAKKE